MNFNTILDLKDLSKPVLGKLLRNPMEFYEIYANRINFYEWLKIYFYNKNFAILLNNIVGNKFDINPFDLNLCSQSIAGENELELLTQLTVEFPFLHYLSIDFNTLNSHPIDILDSLQKFNNLKTLAISSK